MNELQERILKSMDLTRQLSEEEIHEAIDLRMKEEIRKTPLDLLSREKLHRNIFYEIRQLGILQSLIENPEITEIMVNGTSGIFIETKGKLKKLDICFESREKLTQVIWQITADCNRAINDASPIVDARLKDGARVNVVLDPVAINGPILTVRRFPKTPITMDQLIELQSITCECRDWLKQAVQDGANILVCGGTGSGKTTFLNVLSQYIPSEERVITIEDSAELQLLGIPNLIRLETRNANVEGCKEITIRDLIKTALRMRPDRIIVGEVRGKEAIDLMSAFNTGHDGSLSTAHANSARDLLSRMETMMLMGVAMPLSAIRRQMASGIDIIIHLGRLRDRSRRVLEIAEVIDIHKDEIELQSLYRFVEQATDEKGKIMGELQKINSLRHTQKLEHRGI